MQVQIVNKSNHRLPEYAHPGDAGMDLKANLDEPMTIRPGETALIPTGLYMALPDGVYGNIKPRSSTGRKKILVFEGVVEKTYRGEWFISVMNLSFTDPVVIYPGDRLAQVVFTKYETIEWNEVRELDSTERGEGGFGSSGR